MSERGSVRQPQLLPMRTVVAKVVPPVPRAAPPLLILNAIRDFFCCGPKSLATCFELCHGDLLKNILLVVVAVFVWPAVVVFVVTVFAAFVAVFVAVFVAPFAIVFVVAVLYYVGCLCHRAFWLSFGWQTKEAERERA